MAERAEQQPLTPPGQARPVEQPPWPGPVLVLAPHPDDESAGPGGALALHHQRGDEISVLFVTTGVHGDPTGGADAQAYVQRRRAEAHAACDVLGVGSREFLDLPDGCAVSAADLAAVAGLLQDAFLRLRPATVYVPHPGESHSDHHFVARAALAARQGLANPPVLVGYEVWSPLVAEVALDVTAVYETKRAAVRCHPSQLAHTDILSAIEGLNTYRAILLPWKPGGVPRRAECFRVLE